MDSFFNFLRKSLIGTTMVIFAFMVTYVPHQHNQIHEAEAAWPTIDASNIIQTTASAIFNNLTSIATMAMEYIESVADGIAWVAAKGIAAAMVDDFILWAQNGFYGKPMFVEDITGFLRDTADRVLGEYLDELGGIGSFLCDPFRLDIRLALELNYANQRLNEPPTCTITGIVDNIENFITGAQGSFSQGGWDHWFNITAQPSVYTPYGAFLSAEAGAQAQIASAQAEEDRQLLYGNGFLSVKDCNSAPIPGGAGEKEVCSVVTPGKIFQEALSFNIDSQRQSLIEADEINEILVAVLVGLSKRIFNKGNSLLGA